MKKSKLFVAALLGGLMVVTSAFSTEGNKSGMSAAEAQNVVREQIVSALAGISAVDQEVVVKFVVSENRSFELVEVEGQDKELVNTVKAELKNEKIYVPAELEGFYSVKVLFSDHEIAKKEDASTIFRSQIADALSTISASEPSAVKVQLFVNNGTVKLRKVEGDNKALVSSVEAVLKSASIVPPAELAGNYNVTVKF